MIREGTIPFGQYETWYRIAGQPESPKTPLLLLHGGPGSTHDCFEVFDHLADEDDRPIICYDELGCGHSYLNGHPELWVMETWIRELINLREALGLQDVILLGHSFGGMIVLSYMCRHAPQGVRGIVLSSTLPSTNLWSGEQLRMADGLPRHLRDAVRHAVETGDFSGHDYREAEAFYMLLHCEGTYGPDIPACVTRPKRFGDESYAVAWGTNEFNPCGTLRDYDVTSLLSTLTVPALVLSGELDMCTPRIAGTMADRIPHARWEMFPGCRHMSFLEDHDRYCAVLLDWLHGLD